MQLDREYELRALLDEVHMTLLRIGKVATLSLVWTHATIDVALVGWNVSGVPRLLKPRPSALHLCVAVVFVVYL